MAGCKVLFVTVDQTRADALSCLGHPCARTPNLDALAADGVLFRRHFAQCSPCGPSRASLLTGLYQMNHRSVRNGTPLDRRHTNLALEARKAGYTPTLFGYSDSSADPRDYAAGDPALRSYEGVLPGFEVGCRMSEEGWPWRSDLAAKGYKVPAEPLDVYRPLDGGAGFSGPETHAPRPLYAAEDSDTAFLTEQVLTWLRLRRNQDWFVHLAYLRPHPPLIAPEPYNTLIDPAAVPAALRPDDMAGERTRHPFLDWLHSKHGAPDVYTGHDVNMSELAGAELAQVRATYFGLLAEVDHHIGRVLEHLKATGEYEETLIVVASDHGELLGDHGLFGKEGWFEQAFHVPLIVRDPRARAAPGRGCEVTAFTEAVDVMPTILDWLDREPPVECDGRSLLGLVAGDPPANWRRQAHFEFDFRDPANRTTESRLGLAPDQCTLNVLRGERYKYVHFAALPPLLFDLTEDPGEQRNLAADPAYREILLACAQDLLSWRMLHADRRFTNTQLTAAGPVQYRGPRTAET